MNPPQPSAEPHADECGALLSALADGDASALQRGCAIWRDDARARATWHAYHLIGDVLRSDDLAAAPARDAAFVAAMRVRLASEPILLAPLPPLPPPTRRRHVWLLPAAAAAGFVAVAGVMIVARMSTSIDAAPVVAVSRPPAQALTLAGSAALAPQPVVIEGRLIRDARLESYFRAHREAVGGAAAAGPGGVPRNLGTLAPIAPALAPAAAR